MAQTPKSTRIFASLTALLLVLMLVASVALTTYHHHDDHHDEENCAVCQLIEATITTLRNTLSAPISTWGIFTAFTPFLLVGYVLSVLIVSDTLVEQKMRCNN